MNYVLKKYSPNGNARWKGIRWTRGGGHQDTLVCGWLHFHMNLDAFKETAAGHKKLGSRKGRKTVCHMETLG